MESQRVEGGRGVAWLKEGWALFMLNPGLWLVLTILWVVIVLVLGLIPFLGGLVLSLVMPAIMAGLLVGAKRLEEGADLEVGVLFAGLTDPVRRTPLLILGALSLVASIIAGIIALVPTLAMEIAKDLPLFGKAITSVWPGGRRESDPPPPPPPTGGV